MLYLFAFLCLQLTKCLIFCWTFSQRICVGSIRGTILVIIHIAEIITAEKKFKLKRLSWLTLNKDFHPLVYSTNKMTRNKYIRVFPSTLDWLWKQFDLTQDMDNCSRRLRVWKFLSFPFKSGNERLWFDFGLKSGSRYFSIWNNINFQLILLENFEPEVGAWTSEWHSFFFQLINFTIIWPIWRFHNFAIRCPDLRLKIVIWVNEISTSWMMAFEML